MLAPAQAQVDFGAPIVSHRSTRLSKGLATGQDVPAQARSTGNPSTINESGESRRIFPRLAHHLALTLIRSAPHFSQPRFD